MSSASTSSPCCSAASGEAHGGVDLAAGDLRGRLRGRRAHPDLGVRQVRGDPPAGLGDAVRVRGDRRDLVDGACPAGPCSANRTASSASRTITSGGSSTSPSSTGGRRPPRCSRAARSRRPPSRRGRPPARPGCRGGHELGALGLGEREQRLLGERRVRAEEADSRHARTVGEPDSAGQPSRPRPDELRGRNGLGVHAAARQQRAHLAAPALGVSARRLVGERRAVRVRQAPRRRRRRPAPGRPRRAGCSTPAAVGPFPAVRDDPVNAPSATNPRLGLRARP